MASAAAADAVAIIGGTGEQGVGLALRFASAGRTVHVGSRRPERAVETAEQIRTRVPGARVEGHANDGAARAAQGGFVILSVPFEHTVATLHELKDALAPGTVVVSMGVPLASAIGDVAARMLTPSQGSVAELVASLVPEGVSVVSAFQNVAAHRLAALPDPVECDVIVSGTPAPRKRVVDLCGDIPGVRAIDGGPLYNARYVEALTALMIGINIRYKLPDGVGLRLTYV